MENYDIFYTINQFLSIKSVETPKWSETIGCLFPSKVTIFSISCNLSDLTKI